MVIFSINQCCHKQTFIKNTKEKLFLNCHYIFRQVYVIICKAYEDQK